MNTLILHQKVAMVLHTPVIQVFAIEFVTFTIEFVTFTIEFVPFAVEFVGFAIKFVVLAIEFNSFTMLLH